MMYAERHIGEGERRGAGWCTGTGAQAQGSLLAKRLYGYDRSATLDDAATLNDTTRNDATHDDLATPTTTTRPTSNVNADWRA